MINPINMQVVQGFYNSVGMQNLPSKALGIVSNLDFSQFLQAGTVDKELQVESYTNYLKSKYGNLQIKSIPKDQKTLDKMGQTMSGNDVIIAPNILEEMATNPEKANYYESKIDDYFNNFVPRETAICAAQGKVFESCGVIVHEDGTITEICGCRDSDERIAEVEKEHREKREKQAANMKRNLEISQKAADERRRLYEEQSKKLALNKSVMDMLFLSNTNSINRSALSKIYESGTANETLYSSFAIDTNEII